MIQIDYKTFLNKSRKEFMKISRIKTLAIEIFKTVNELNPNSMKTISRVQLFDLLVKNLNTWKVFTNYEKSLVIREVLRYLLFLYLLDTYYHTYYFVIVIRLLRVDPCWANVCLGTS